MPLGVVCDRWTILAAADVFLRETVSKEIIHWT